MASSTDVWYTRCQVPTGFSLALQAGLFAEDFPAGGKPRLLALQDAADASVAQSHFTHSQARSIRHGSSYPAIWAYLNGADTRVVAMSSLRGAQTVLTLPDSPIATPADLKGKRLLVVRRPHEPIDYLYAVTLRIYEAALASAGLGLDDVTLVEHIIDRPFVSDRVTTRYGTPGHGDDTASAGSRAPAYGLWRDLVYPLLSHEVDAITSGGGIGAASLQFEFLLGLRPIFDLSSLPSELARANNSTPLVFAVKSDLLDSDPDLVVRMLMRVLQAEQRAREMPEEAIRCIAREQSVPETLVARAYGPHLLSNLRIGIDAAQLEALQSQIDFLHAHGITKRRFDVHDWVVADYLEQARARLSGSARCSSGATLTS